MTIELALTGGDRAKKTLKIDAFSPLYELESALQCALDAIEVTESQDEK